MASFKKLGYVAAFYVLVCLIENGTCARRRVRVQPCVQVQAAKCPDDHPVEAYQDYPTEDKRSVKMCCIKSKSEHDETTKTIKNALSCGLTNVCTSAKDADKELCADKPKRFVNGKGYEWEEAIRTECDDGRGSKGVMPFCCTKDSTESMLMTVFGAERHEFPYYVRVINHVGHSYHLCGGTIYNKRYIVTAAHCTTNNDKKEVWGTDGYEVVAGIGQSLLDATEANKYKVEQLIPHPNASVTNKSHDAPHKINDIALLRLDRDIVFGDDVKALPIADANFIPNNFSENALILGFGTTNTLAQADALLKANTLIRDNKKNFGPRTVYGASYAKNQEQYLVIGGFQDRVYSPGTGEGDSGGPAVCRNKDGLPVLCGVTSFGTGDVQKCIDGKLPCPTRVFVKVPFFNKWIKDTAGKQDDKVLFKKALYGDKVVDAMYEHQVHVTSPSGKRCGGTLISKDTVVTAAQCVADDDGNVRKDVEVQQGRTDLRKKQKNAKVFGAKSIRILKGFKKEGEPIRGKRIVYPIGPNHVPGRQIAVDSYYTNDLAVIKLNGSYNVTQDKFPKLPDDDQTDESKYPVYGTEVAFPRKLAKGGARLQRQFKLISQRDCQSRMARLTKVGYKIKPKDENVLCGVEMYSGGSTCDRELGGGLICKGKNGKDVLCGVQIFRLCQFNIPNRFFNVGKQRKWIKS